MHFKMNMAVQELKDNLNRKLELVNIFYSYLLLCFFKKWDSCNSWYSMRHQRHGYLPAKQEEI